SVAGYIVLPGSDDADGAEALVTLDAATEGGDTGTGSAGSYVEELFGDLVIAIFAVDPDTCALLPLPDHKQLTLSRGRNGPGSISLTRPADGSNFAVLRDTITADLDLEVAIWTNGHKQGALREYRQESFGDDVVDDRTWSFIVGLAEILV